MALNDVASNICLALQACSASDANAVALVSNVEGMLTVVQGPGDGAEPCHMMA